MKQTLKTLTLLSLLVSLPLAWAGPAYENQLITGNGGFGVASQGEWLIVGEPSTCIAHTYRLDYDTMLYGDGNGTPGVPFQDVRGSNTACPSVLDRGFGEVVAIDGDTMVVGAPQAKSPKTKSKIGKKNGNNGTVFIFQFNGILWVPVTQAFTTQADDGSEFGSAVSISGDLIAVGARFDEGNAVESGGVYLYRWDPDAQPPIRQIAFIPGENIGDVFGNAVSIWVEKLAGGTQGTQQVMVGAPGYDTIVPAIENAGAAYLYEMNGDTPVEIDFITINVDAGWDDPQAVGTEVSVGADLSLLAGLAAYPMQRVLGNLEPKFQYTRSQGGDVSQSEGVSAFGINTIGVDIYPNVLNDNADQRSNYHLEIELNGGGPTDGLAEDIRLYKDIVAVNDNANNGVHSLFFPCGYGGELKAYEWKMVSIPCGLPAGTTVEEAFNADIFPGLCDIEEGDEACGVLGEYGVGWEVWEQTTDFTSLQPTLLLSAGDLVVNGKGYWIITDAAAKEPGQPVYWNVDESTSTLRTVFDPADDPGFARPEEVAGYKRIDLDVNMPVDEPAYVLLGNPFSRPFQWPNVGVTITSFLESTTAPVEDANAIPFQYSITGYLQKPEYDEANPYIAMTNTPGFGGTTQVPVNAGFWIAINPGPDQVSTDSLWIPFEK
jgi:hypothetical protein